MQPSAVPDLAHTRTRPVHWLATAAAMAGVVALAGLFQPDGATANQPERKATTAAPDPADVRLPLECPGTVGVVTGKAIGDLDGDGGQESVITARCNAGSGSPPAGIYVLNRAKDGQPRVVATLLTPADGLSVSDLAVRDGAVRATLLGYSSPDVPTCCPDEQEQVSWKWRGGAFVRTVQGQSDTAAM
ncbi:hypothetical protein ACH41E_15570 [Streptomyces sp. NPDC020412]|uniref:hypothetical protein n=1 Tax=Streptomyces sp. NPDC020412 TaxID=3365073 RepID=UPI0037B7C075